MALNKGSNLDPKTNDPFFRVKNVPSKGGKIMGEERILADKEKEKQVVADTADTAAAQEEPQGTGSIERVADVSIEEAPAEAKDEISVETGTTPAEPAVPTVAPRPHKPHCYARPCPNWDKYCPGSPLLKEGERPCQGWCVKPGTSQCYNCFLEERYVAEGEAAEQPQRITYGVIHKVLEVAKSFFQQVTDDFKETSQAREAASILNSALESFTEGPQHYAAAYQKVQKAVPFLLSCEAQWLEDQLRSYLEESGREAEFGKWVEKAVARYTEGLTHARAEAEKNGRQHPAWVPPFDLRKEYRLSVLKKKRQTERRHYVNGLRDELAPFFPQQKGKDRQK